MANWGKKVGFRATKKSKWWHNLNRLEEVVNGWRLNYRLHTNIMRKVEVWREVRFWTDRWVGNVKLSESFPRLFSIAIDKNLFISDLGMLEDYSRSSGL